MFGPAYDVTGKICTRWNERESTWRKSGSRRSHAGCGFNLSVFALTLTDNSHSALTYLKVMSRNMVGNA
jgi:hypothetical protein